MAEVSGVLFQEGAPADSVLVLQVVVGQSFSVFWTDVDSRREAWRSAFAVGETEMFFVVNRKGVENTAVSWR